MCTYIQICALCMMSMFVFHSFCCYYIRYACLYIVCDVILIIYLFKVRSEVNENQRFINETSKGQLFHYNSSYFTAPHKPVLKL